MMGVSKEGNVKYQITLDNNVLEQTPRYKYLGSWITENAQCDNEIKTRIAMAKQVF